MTVLRSVASAAPSFPLTSTQRQPRPYLTPERGENL